MSVGPSELNRHAGRQIAIQAARRLRDELDAAIAAYPGDAPNICRSHLDAMRPLIERLLRILDEMEARPQNSGVE